MNPLLYALFFKIVFGVVILVNILVIVNAVLSAKTLGGTLGQSLKKIVAGTITHIILFVTYIFLEGGNRGMLSDDQIRLFFMITGIFGSILLCSGFVQLYQIGKRLKLFTV